MIKLATKLTVIYVRLILVRINIIKGFIEERKTKLVRYKLKKELVQKSLKQLKRI